MVAVHMCCREFGQEGPFWGREYIFWHNKKPLTLIHEVFSPALEDFLGPMYQYKANMKSFFHS
jgi:chorismate-pyruvate lyase